MTMMMMMMIGIIMMMVMMIGLMSMLSSSGNGLEANQSAAHKAHCKQVVLPDEDWDRAGLLLLHLLLPFGGAAAASLAALLTQPKALAKAKLIIMAH